MKIIKKGFDPNKWSLKVICKKELCGGCGAKLEVNKDDLSISQISRYDWDSDSSYIKDEVWYECPCCGERKFIDSEKIPCQVYRKIKRREYY